MPEARTEASPFWRFSLRIYPKVADTCLALQDRFGVDVNILLFLLFAAHHGRRLDAAAVGRLTAATAAWSGSVVVPLRSVRRALREPPGLVETAGAAALRQKVKAAELEAERLQQEGLYRFMPLGEWGTAEPAREAAARANVDTYATTIAQTFDPALVEALLAGLRGLGPPPGGLEPA